MTQKHPNILFITTDEHRFDALGCYGNTIIKTPNIDSIAEQGVLFERRICTKSNVHAISHGYHDGPLLFRERM